jgi:outer membrane protein assembly factor BamD
MISKFKVLPVLITLLFIWSCGGKEDDKKILLESTDLEQQMIEAYKKGVEAFNQGDVLYAAKNFNIVENIYPQSIWASKSVIMSAYAYYSQDYYGDAIYETKRFLKNYPNSDYVPYARYLLALCYYEEIEDKKRDIEPLLMAKKNFEKLIVSYPNTDFSMDAKYKILLIDNLLASKELYVAKYYLTKGKWIPALNRLKVIIEEYDETVYVEEALHRLVEVHYKIGLVEESKKYAKLLGYNYLSGKWYKQSYKIFDKDYYSQNSKIKKKEKSKIIKSLKSLFN